MMIEKQTLDFLKQLKQHNNREWFEANRSKYEVAKENFATVVEDIISGFGKHDPTIATLAAKDCTFRINRDIRFSKDKSPYKINMAASFVKGGKKSTLAGYYFHLEPGNNSMAGGGVWMPDANTLKKLRQEVDYNFSGFSKIIKGKNFKKQFADLDQSKELKLSREPKGYTADNPAIEYLKLKSFVVMKTINDEMLVSQKLVKEVVDIFTAMQPLVKFLNDALED